MNPKVLLGRIWRNLNRQISRRYVDLRLAPAPSDRALVLLGEGEGRWHAPADLAAGSICYCVGVGVDPSFDFALAERFSAEVHSFDPTPKAVAHMAEKNGGRVDFHPWGMLDADREIRFYRPYDERHGSSFAEDLHATGRYDVGQCYRLSTIMQKLGHTRIDLLKIDIEGSWYPVIGDFLAAGIRPAQVNVEFDSPAPLWRVRASLRALDAAGYRPVLRMRDNVVFLRD